MPRKGCHGLRHNGQMRNRRAGGVHASTALPGSSSATARAPHVVCARACMRARACVATFQPYHASYKQQAMATMPVLLCCTRITSCQPLLLPTSRDSTHLHVLPLRCSSHAHRQPERVPDRPGIHV